MKLLLTLLISINLLAQTTSADNPVIYSALGDSIYNNAKSIEELSTLKEFQVYKDKIIAYIKEVDSTKAKGFAIEDGDKSISKGEYLKELRTLSKTNDFFVQNIKSNFKYALKNEDNDIFVNSVDSGLLDTKRYEKDIRTYYYKHEDEINEYGHIMGKLVNGYESIKVKKKVYKGKSKQEVQDEKMKRIRKKDKNKQKAIQKSLEDELLKKKSKIREEQKEELRATSK